MRFRIRPSPCGPGRQHALPKQLTLLVYYLPPALLTGQSAHRRARELPAPESHANTYVAKASRHVSPVRSRPSPAPLDHDAGLSPLRYAREARHHYQDEYITTSRYTGTHQSWRRLTKRDAISRRAPGSASMPHIIMDYARDQHARRKYPSAPDARRAYHDGFYIS